MGLTPKQKNVFEYLCRQIDSTGIVPSYDEIRQQFGFASYNSVQKYIKQLEAKGFIRTPWGSAKRAIEIVPEKRRQVVSSPKSARAVSLPLLGKVAAGEPIEALENPVELDIPESMMGRGEHFLLEVSGESMMNEGILDSDVILVKRSSTANNGDIVIASVDHEVTVKRYYKKKDCIELRPSHPTMKPIYVYPGTCEFKILGLCAGLMRQY